jgi:hypothetical protein
LTGTFAKVDLPEGVSWDTARLTYDGTVRAIGLGPPTPILLPPIISSNSLTLRFATVSFRTYVVETASSLGATARWTTYATRVGNGAQVSVFVPTTGKERYFRLRAY